MEKYLKKVNSDVEGDCHFVCGYEADCLGDSLYKETIEHPWKGFSVECVILAPSKIPKAPGDRIKIDFRDANKIAECLENGKYSPVYVLNEEDDAVKNYILMRDDAQTILKATTQQINGFCLRHGKRYEGKSKWTA